MEEIPSVLVIQPRIHKLERTFLGETPETIVTDALIQRVARKLSKLTLQSEFISDTVIDGITGTARDEMQEAFQSVIQEEQESREFYKGKKYGSPTDPLLRHIEKNMGADVHPEKIQLSVPDDFFDSFAQAVNQQRRTLDFVERAREHPTMKAYILPLLQQLSALDKDGWHLHEGGAERAYNVIKPLVNNKRYTIPHAEAELLYILTYIPSSVRHPVQELLVHHSYMDFVQNQRSAAQEKGEPTEMHDSLSQFLEYGVFCNHHWQRLSNYEGSSEAMNTELAEIQVLYKQTEKNLMVLARQNPAYAEVLQAFLIYTKDLYDRIEKVHKEQGCYALQQRTLATDFSRIFSETAVMHSNKTALQNAKDGKTAQLQSFWKITRGRWPAGRDFWKKIPLTHSSMMEKGFSKLRLQRF